MAFSKDTALEFLAKGDIEGFNSARPTDPGEFLDFSELDFSGCVDISGANLSNADLNNTNFTELEIVNVDFSNSDLTSATFLRANLVDVDFSGANLSGVIFTSSTCKANFADADLSGADFSDGDFAESEFGLSENMTLCKFDSYTVWPDETDLPDDFDSSIVKDATSDEEEEAPKSDGYY